MASRRQRELSFSVVERPGKGAMLPERLVRAIDGTVDSGKAIRIDTKGMSVYKQRMLYRALHAYAQSAPYRVQRRRTPVEVYVWGESQ